MPSLGNQDSKIYFRPIVFATIYVKRAPHYSYPFFHNYETHAIVIRTVQNLVVIKALAIVLHLK